MVEASYLIELLFVKGLIKSVIKSPLSGIANTFEDLEFSNK